MRRGAMGLDSSIILITLHEHIGVRCVGATQDVEQTTRFIGIDLARQRAGDLLKRGALAGLGLDGGDDTDHGRLLLL